MGVMETLNAYPTHIIAYLSLIHCLSPVRISGTPLGRPPANVSKEKKKQVLEDEKIRSSIEGKFGVSKRRFSLARVMTKLANTSETAMAITFLVMNLSTWLRQVFCVVFCQDSKTTPIYGFVIIKSYNLAG